MLFVANVFEVTTANSISGSRAAMRRQWMLFFLAIGCLLPIGCARSPQSQINITPAAFAPSDTPFIFAYLEPIPEQFSNRTAQIAELGAKFFDAVKKSGETENAMAGEKPQRFDALDGIVELLSSDTAMLAVGLKPRAAFAVYGIGYTPVLRIEISDAKVFADYIESKLRQEKRGMPNNWARVTRTPLRDGTLIRAEPTRFDSSLYLAIEGSQLTIALHLNPPSAKGDAAFLIKVFPANPPKFSAITSLQQLQKSQGYLPSGLGYFDATAVLRAVIELTETQEAIKIWVPLSSLCAAEMQALATLAPRLSFGATQITQENIKFKSVVHLKPDLANRLMAVPKRMPYYGDGAMMKFAISADFERLDTILRDLSIKPNSTNFRCERLESFTKRLAESRSLLQSVRIPSLAGKAFGFGVSIDQMKFGVAPNGQQRFYDMSASISAFTEDPNALFALLGLTDELKRANLLAPYTIGALPIPPEDLKKLAVLGEGDPLLLIRKDAITLGFGVDQSTKLGEIMVQPNQAGGTFLQYAYGSSFIGEIAKQEFDNDKSVQQLINQLQKLFARSSTDVRFTANGIEDVGTFWFASAPKKNMP